MFQGMSTNPSESTGPAAPATPDPAGGADGKPTAADQAKADGADVAVAVLKGAATGGLSGAAIGALKGAAKTKTGRNVAIAAVAAPILAVSLLTGLVFGAVQSTMAAPAGRATIAQTAALTAFENKDELRSIQDAATQGGVPWPVIAGIYQTVKNKSGDKGTGPFGIDMAKAGSEISEADANNFDKAAVYVARKLKAAAPATIDMLPDPSLDAGYMDTRGDKNESVLKPIDNDLAKAVRDKVKAAYVAALTAVPLQGNPATAETVFAGSLKWMAGNPPDKCGPGTVNVGGNSAGSLNPKQTAYAQAIINQVAAKGMPENAAIIAIATAMQESTLQMYWNAQVPGSKELSDGGPEGGFDLTDGRISYSVGLFQQQVHGNSFPWGTVEDAMNPTKSTDMFLEALLKVPGWQDMPLTVAAQTVQRSAFPSAYADDEVTARKVVSELKPTTGSYGTTTTSGPSNGSSPATSSNSCGPATGGVGTGGMGKGDDYPFKDAQIYTPDPWGLYYRECTSFTAWRINVQMGYKEGGPWPFTVATQGVGLFGDGGQWGHTLGSKYPVDKTPKPGAVAWWGPYFSSSTTNTQEYGHVGIVGAVNPDGTVLIEEYNFGYNHNYHTRTIPAGDVSGYIHIADIP